MAIEIIFGVTQAVITAILGVFFKETVIPSRFIPIQNIIIGVVSGLLAYYFGIYADIPTSLMLCLAISLGVGGAYDVVSIPKKSKEQLVPETSTEIDEDEEE